MFVILWLCIAYVFAFLVDGDGEEITSAVILAILESMPSVAASVDSGKRLADVGLFVVCC
jgi:hypothetical protein